MNPGIVDILFYLNLLLILPPLFVVIYNYFTFTGIPDEECSLLIDPKVSILIPARNEENNIETSIKSVLNQSYANFELIILDDNSVDNTAGIINELLNKDERIKLIPGKELPNGWLGKNWACHQLSEYATGEILLFIDADVKLNRHALSQSLRIFSYFKLDMLSCFPTQEITSWGEGLIVPMMNWLLLSFLPLRSVYTSPNKSFVAANGQFIMISKNHYYSIGGHKLLKAAVVEDMEMARVTKETGRKIMTVVGSSGVMCKMYDGFHSAFSGFSKNFFAGFNTSIPLFILIISYFIFTFLLPFLFIFLSVKFTAIIILVLFLRLLISIISRQNILFNILFHPIQLIIMSIIGINSLISIKTGKLVWKGRKI